MKTYIWPLLLTLCVIAGCNTGAVQTASTPAAKQSAASISPVSPAQNSPEALAVEIKPLDATGNPYAGQYQDWDRWAYTNRRSLTKGKDASPLEGLSADQTFMSAALDKDCWLLPYSEYQRLYFTALSDGKLSEFRSATWYVTAVGKKEPKFRPAMKEAYWRVLAKLYPKVPSWLAQNPPTKAMLLPDGNVATLGPLGSGLIESGPADEDCDTCKKFYLYSPSGVLLTSVKGHWWTLYQQMKKLPLPNGVLYSDDQGYVEFKDADTQKVLSLWDYDATAIVLGTRKAPGRLFHFSMLPPKFIQELATSQASL